MARRARTRTDQPEDLEPDEEAAEARLDEPSKEPALEIDTDQDEADVEELTPEEELEAVKAERDEYLQKWQRARADYQNLKRRGLAEAEDRMRRAIQPLLEKMLVVLDYLDLALASPASTEESRNLAMGVKLTRDQFLQVLEQEQVRPIPRVQSFDPTLHEATGAVVRADLEPGTIVETVRTGYLWGEEVLRHAHVIVARVPSEPPVEGIQAEGDAEPKEDSSAEASQGEV